MSIEAARQYIAQWRGKTSEHVLREKLRGAGYPDDLIEQAFGGSSVGPVNSAGAVPGSSNRYNAIVAVVLVVLLWGWLADGGFGPLALLFLIGAIFFIFSGRRSNTPATGVGRALVIVFVLVPLAILAFLILLFRAWL